MNTLALALQSAFPSYGEAAHRKVAERMVEDMEAQHTPGPWGVSAQPHGYSVWNVVDDEINPACIGRPVANVVGGYDSVQIEEANARLIAAAPDLYLVSHLIEELSTQTRTQTDWQIEFERIATLARAAIAKARK